MVAALFLGCIHGTGGPVELVETRVEGDVPTPSGLIC